MLCFWERYFTLTEHFSTHGFKSLLENYMWRETCTISECHPAEVVIPKQGYGNQDKLLIFNIYGTDGLSAVKCYTAIATEARLATNIYKEIWEPSLSLV